MRKKKKILSLVLALSMIVTMISMPVSATEVTPLTDTTGSLVQPEVGDGTQDAPYQIATADNLYWFAAKVNGTGADGTQNKAACAILVSDITVNTDVLNSDGTLMGSGDNFRVWDSIENYEGTFDGKGHTIKGLYKKGTTAYGGLFIMNYGIIQNVNVADSYFEGLLGGGVCSDNNGSITNCTNSGSVNGTHYVGGVCGLNTGSITNCTNSGMVNGTGDYVGGVCGYNMQNGTITSSRNSGSVSANALCGGGVCGQNLGTITNCINSGSVSCNVSGTPSVGGVCGLNAGSIENCTNRGSVTGNGDAKTGGVSGENQGSIANCTNSGSVSGTSFVGGVSGCNIVGSIANCINSGEVIGSSLVGGVAGYSQGTIENTFYSGYTQGIGNVGDEAEVCTAFIKKSEVKSINLGESTDKLFTTQEDTAFAPLKTAFGENFTVSYSYTPAQFTEAGEDKTATALVTIKQPKLDMVMGGWSKTETEEIVYRCEVTVTVNKATPTLVLTASPESTQSYGEDITLTATVTGRYPSNSDVSVDFNVDGKKETVKTNESGVATYVVKNKDAGTYTFDAEVAVDDNNEKADAVDVSYTITQADQSALTINSSSTHTFGSVYTLSSTGGSTEGAVTYKITGGTGSGTLSGDKLTITQAGTIKMTATKVGDKNYNTVTSKPFTLTVNKADTTVSVADKNTIYNKTSVTVGSAEVTTDSTGDVTYKYYSDSDCNNEISAPINAGTYYVKATVAGDDNYNGAVSDAGTITISPKPVTITDVHVDNKIYDGTSTATISSNGTVNGVVSGDDVSVESGICTFADANVGDDRSVTATGFSIAGADSGNYKLSVQPEVASAKITPAALTVSVEKVVIKVGQSIPTLQVNVTGFVHGERADTLEGFEMPTTAIVGEIDTTDISLTSFPIKLIGGAATANYEFEPFPTTVSVTINHDHIWDEGRITTPATAATEGVKTYTCKHCDATKTESIAKLPPTMMEGADSVYIAGSKDPVTFRSDAALADLLNVSVDGKVIDKANYTTAEGSTIVTLKPEYLATLSSGEHTVAINSVSGSAEVKFTIENKPSDETKPDGTSKPVNVSGPDDSEAAKTGDTRNMMLWIAVLLVSGGAVAGVSMGKKRKKGSGK